VNRLVLASVFVAACGGGKAAAPTTPSPPPAEHDHAAFPPEVASFHELLEPLWQGVPGQDEICAVAGEALTRANMIVGAPPPAEVDDRAAWIAASETLMHDAEQLAAHCDDGDAVAADDLGIVHDGFHALVALLAADEHTQP